MPQKGSAPKCTRINLTNLSTLLRISYGEQAKRACVEGGIGLESGGNALTLRERGPSPQSLRISEGLPQPWSPGTLLRRILGS